MKLTGIVSGKDGSIIKCDLCSNNAIKIVQISRFAFNYCVNHLPEKEENKEAEWDYEF